MSAAPVCGVAGYFPGLPVAVYPAPKCLPAPYRPENAPRAPKRPPGRPAHPRAPGPPRNVLPIAELTLIAERHGATMDRVMARTFWKTDPEAWRARVEMWARLVDLGWSLHNIGLAFGGRHHATVHEGVRVFRRTQAKAA